LQTWLRTRTATALWAIAASWALAAAAQGEGARGDAAPAGDSIPQLSQPLNPAALESARALAQLQRNLATDDLAAAEQSLARARGSALLADYVALFEARLWLAGGKTDEAAAAARRGRDAHAGAPVAGAFSELLGEALAASGDESGARSAWGVAFEATRSPDRRAELESRIVASHERTGTLHAALAQPGGDTTVADGAALPPSIVRQLQTDPSPEELLRRADEQMSQGKSEDAILTFDAALDAGLERPDAQHATRERAHALFRIRRYDEALVAFGSLLPDREARFWHARSLARLGRPNQAIRSFEEIGAADDPEYGSWALYLAGTLLEDRGETARAMALYEEVTRREVSTTASSPASSRGLDALWRLGWSAFGRNENSRARNVFIEMAARSDPLPALRPRYWAARAAENRGDKTVAATEYTLLAVEYPLSYYGWRASERLGSPPGIVSPQPLAPGRSRVALQDVHRVEALILANLGDFAQEELAPIGRQARGLEDRKAVGRLYWLAGDYHRAQRLVVDAYQLPLSRGVQPENRILWQLSWPAAYREIVQDVFPENAAIEPELVWAIMREESGYRPWITSSAGARGLLQIMPETGEQLAKKNGVADFDPNDLYTPSINIQLGAAYLDELSRRFPGRLSAAIGSYNAGPRAVNGWLQGDRKNRDDDAWVEDIPYKQTRSYVKRVLRSLHVYQSFYDETSLMGPAVPVGPAASASES
jgi:soluble lytic murein transglycosylase